MIKVIIFDLGKVLLDFNNHLIARRLSEVSGRNENDIYEYIFHGGTQALFDRGEISPDDYLKKINADLSLSLRMERFIPLWSDIFTPIPGMLELVQSLKSRYQIGILSNVNVLHFHYVRERYPVVREIANYHLSYEMHLQKPDIAIYRQVLQRYGCAPEELAYTDDIEPYVIAARGLGIHAFLFSGAEQLKKDFAAIGITS